MSRSRVAPVKAKSIPQLELTAVLLGCRLAKYICSVLTVKFHICIWSDNLPCLQWIAGNNSNIVYVKNRVSEILSLKEEFKFDLHHVTLKENPTDLLSRGTSVSVLAQSSLWLRGPYWLMDVNHVDTNIKMSQVQVSEIITQNIPIQVGLGTDPIFEVDKYSTLSKLLGVTKAVFKFLALCNRKFTTLDSHMYWIRQQQQCHYPLVYEALKTHSRENKFAESLRFIADLDLYLDNKDIIHSRGCLNVDSSDLGMVCPMLLSPKSYLCTLIIEDCHMRNHHAGVQETLSLVRRVFWISRGRQTIKKTLQRCVVCQYDKRKAFKYPGPPPLPLERTSLNRPFQNTGVDFTGAVKVKNEKGEVTKYYICLFTCTAVRAVHLELIHSLSAEAFLLCLRRFVARCSLPDKLISDNGTNFQATSKFLVSFQKNDAVQRYLDDQKIQWYFISPRAPWQGGMYERMIGTVKSSLHKALHHKTVSVSELVTVLSEVEAVVNNRPLVYLDDDIKSSEALTPAHLLYGRRIFLFPSFESHDYEFDQIHNTEILHGYNNKITSIINCFERIWSIDYLQSL